MKVAVYGMGKIGSALSAALLKASYEVIGVDINEELVKKLNSGRYRTKEPGVAEIINKALNRGKFLATTDGVEASKNSKVKIIIVPVVLGKDRKPNLKPVIDVTEVIAKGLKKGDLVVTETTLPIGTTKYIVADLLEKKTKLKAGIDFYVAHAPERVYVGRILEDYKKYPKIVGGINRKSGLVAKKFYERVVPKVILMEDSNAAEASKIFGITYRNVNIALANELFVICEKFGIDYSKVREVVNTIPFFNLHKPGIPGGHCVPVYPHFLPETKMGLVRKALEVNESLIVDYWVSIVKKELKKLGKTLKEARIGILGRSYRSGVKEDRYAASIILLKKFKRLGCKVLMYDPLYDETEMEAIGAIPAKSMDELVKKVDVIVVANDDKRYKKVRKITKKPVVEIFKGF